MTFSFRLNENKTIGEKKDEYQPPYVDTRLFSSIQLFALVKAVLSRVQSKSCVRNSKAIP